MSNSIGSVMRRQRAAREKREDTMTEDLLRHVVLRDAVYDAAMEWWAARQDVMDATDDKWCKRAADRLTYARERLDLLLEDAHRREKEGIDGRV